MELSSSSTSSSSSENDDVSQEAVEETILTRQTSVSLVPFVGQRFVSQEAAYEFYCGFAKQRGFTIRRHRTRGKDGVGRGITRRDFTCHRAGFPQTKLESSLAAQPGARSHRNRKSTRCGCQAYMRIVKRSPPEEQPEWRVTGFSDAHNHELLPPICSGPTTTQCAVPPEDKARICVFAKAGMSVRQMLRLMELEKGVKLGCLPFAEADVRNLLRSFRGSERDLNDSGDTIDLVSICKRSKDEDPGFKYEFKIDGHNRLECIAWSYASSVRSYEMFGDAVVFDTTQRLEGHDMLLGFFLGVDNHGVTCFFGCALLRDENTQSFSWALKVFLEFMNGKAPQTISTDHNTWLKEAIAIEMPRTKHAFCIWHIVAKFSNWFSGLLGSRYDEWKSEFHRLHNLDSAEDFDHGWRDMINKYGLHTNRHIISLYALRSFWAVAFLKQYFFAGTMNTSQAESINTLIQRISSAQSQLDHFVHHLANIVESKTQQKNLKVCLKTGSPIESHAASVLTPHAFIKLQEEIVFAPQYASVLSDGYFQVRHHHSHTDGDSRVTWVPCEDHISCTCRHFEFTGILCRHVIRVLSTNNCFHIPDPYLPNRWRRSCNNEAEIILGSSASEKVRLLESMASALVAESMETEERLERACEHVAAALSCIKELPHGVRAEYNNCQPSDDSLILEDHDGIVRFAIGNPKTEVPMRKRRNCSPSFGCGQFGHDPSDCQLIGGADHLSSDALGFL